jgi:hypothetical protein
MADDVLSVPLQTPLVGLQMDTDTAQYVGVLQGTLAALCLNEAKYRAVLELLTGEPWEATRLDINGTVIMSLAVNALVKQTGMGIAQAKTLVNQRWNNRNLPAAVVVPLAVSITDFVNGTATTADTPATTEATVATTAPMSTRFKNWREKQLQDAANLPASAVDEPVAAQSDTSTPVPTAVT